MLAALPVARSAAQPAAAGYPRAPEMMGLTLGMPVDAAVQAVRSIAPAGSVTLPAVRREPFSIVRIEAPAALAAPAEDVPKDPNFYVMLNSAPRILKSQPSRSSHVPFVTLVATEHDRRLVRIVFEPAFVYWPEGYDAGRRTAWTLADLLRERYGAPVELSGTEPPGRRTTAASGGAGGPGQSAYPRADWALRVNAARKSIVLTDLTRLPDASATRLQLD